MSSLKLISETNADTSTTSMEINNVFSNDYKVYKVVSTLRFQTADNDAYIRYMNSSGVISSSNYDTASHMYRAQNSLLLRPTTRTNLNYGGYFTLTTGTTGGGCVEYIYNPFDSNLYTYAINQSIGHLASYGSYGLKTIRVYKDATSITGINIYNGNASNNFGGGKIKIYGVSE